MLPNRAKYYVAVFPSNAFRSSSYASAANSFVPILLRTSSSQFSRMYECIFRLLHLSRGLTVHLGVSLLMVYPHQRVFLYWLSCRSYWVLVVSTFPSALLRRWSRRSDLDLSLIASICRGFFRGNLVSRRSAIASWVAP